MSGGGGGNNQLMGYLPVAAALAATVMTDGAAAPMLGEALGAEAGTTAATVLGAGAMGALTGGASAALTGGNVLQSAAIGGVGGAALGGIGSQFGGAPSDVPTGTETAAPLTGSNVAGTQAVVPSTTAPTGYQGPVSDMSNLGTTPTPTVPDNYTPNNTMDNAFNNAANGTPNPTPTPTNTGLGATLTKYAPYALGATALNAVMQSDKNKYGTPSPASEQYSGPLTKLHYDPSKYTPVTTAQPTPPYTPTYANYGAVPYTAAEGGIMQSYASGGLMDPGSEPLDFASGGMYPQSQQYTSAYATPTQMPATAQATASLYEPKTNPLTGDMMANMAKGGIANVRRYATGGQPQMTPDQITQMQAQMAAQQQPQYDPYAELQQQAMYARLSGLPQVTPTASAQGGLMNSYAPGGAVKGASNMAAIDNYVAQYSSDPASVVAKAQSGDWNAMLAMNKVKNTPNQNYAAGGSTLGGYASGGNPRLLEGPGDGMSDNIPATIGAKQPARLADGEFVVPADVVSHLGNGSTDAGAKRLYNMMDKVRKARTGSKKQGKQINADKYMPA